MNIPAGTPFGSKPGKVEPKGCLTVAGGLNVVVVSGMNISIIYYRGYTGRSNRPRH